MNTSSEKITSMLKAGSLYENLKPDFLKNIKTTRVRLNILFGTITICGIIPLLVFGDRMLAGFFACLTLIMIMLSQRAFLAADLAKAHMDTLQNVVSDALIALDENGRILVANRAAALLLGLNRSELRGQKISHVLDLGPGKITLSGTITAYLRREEADRAPITLSAYPFKDDYSDRVLVVVQKAAFTASSK